MARSESYVVLPKHHTKELLPNMVDEMAKVRPEALYADTPKSAVTYEAGYRKFTNANVANAVNGVTQWLQERLGQGQDHKTLAYTDPNDLVYIFMILGAVKAGYKVHMRILCWQQIADSIHNIDRYSPYHRKAQYKTMSPYSKPQLLTPLSAQSSTLTSTQGVFQLILVDSPNLPYLLTSHHAHYPFPRTFKKTQDINLIHTSKTTADPKPIVHTHNSTASCTQ